MLSQTKVYMAVNRTCHSINGLSLENTGGAKKSGICGSWCKVVLFCANDLCHIVEDDAWPR